MGVPGLDQQLGQAGGRLRPGTPRSPSPGRRPSGRGSGQAWGSGRGARGSAGASSARSARSASAACSASRCGGARRRVAGPSLPWRRRSGLPRGRSCFSRAASRSSMLTAFFRASRPAPVTAWSVFSLSHFARSAGLAARSSSRLMRRRGAVGLLGLDGDRAALGDFQVEAHDRLRRRCRSVRRRVCGS